MLKEFLYQTMIALFLATAVVLLLEFVVNPVLDWGQERSIARQVASCEVIRASVLDIDLRIKTAQDEKVDSTVLLANFGSTAREYGACIDKIDRSKFSLTLRSVRGGFRTR